MRASFLRSAILAAAAGCTKPEAVPGPHVRMDFDRPDGFWSAPFPSDDRLATDVDLSDFVVPVDRPFVSAVVGIAEGETGFGRTSAIGLPFTEPVGELIVRVVDLETGEEAPIGTHFYADGGPYGA